MDLWAVCTHIASNAGDVLMRGDNSDETTDSRVSFRAMDYTDLHMTLLYFGKSLSSLSYSEFQVMTRSLLGILFSWRDFRRYWLALLLSNTTHTHTHVHTRHRAQFDDCPGLFTLENASNLHG